MNSLPEDIQDTIYKYKHQMEFENVMCELKCTVCYCGFCGDRQWMWTTCNCDDDWSDDSDSGIMDYWYDPDWF